MYIDDGLYRKILEKKKQLEEQEKELIQGVDAEDVTYRLETIVDHTSKKNNRQIESKKKDIFMKNGASSSTSKLEIGDSIALIKWSPLSR